MINFVHLYRVVVAQSVGAQAVKVVRCKQEVVGSSTSIDNYGDYIKGIRSTNANRAPQ